MPNNTLTRTDGMIWIDRNPPYRLKYHIHDDDYIVETTVAYDIDLAPGESLATGTVVKLEENNKIKPALFPMDLDNILGIVLQGASNTGTSAVTASISVGKSGSLIILRSEIPDVFVARDHITEGGKTYLGSVAAVGAEAGLIGAPVYWNCGYVQTNSSTYIYKKPEAGKLTVQTPSGQKYRVKSWTDPQTNIGYNNLPQIGNLIEITNDWIKINLNFSDFDSTLEWYWPAIGSTSGTLTGSASNTMKFYHGLLAPTRITSPESIQVSVRCPCHIATETGIMLSGAFSHSIGADGIDSSCSSLTYSIPADLEKVGISGEIIYGFNKR